MQLKMWTDNPIILPLGDALLFHVAEHTTKKVWGTGIIVHRFILDNDMTDPDAEILVQISASVGNVVYENLIYYKDQYWIKARYACGVDAFMPFKEHLALVKEHNGHILDYICDQERYHIYQIDLKKFKYDGIYKRVNDRYPRKTPPIKQI